MQSESRTKSPADYRRRTLAPACAIRGEQLRVGLCQHGRIASGLIRTAVNGLKCPGSSGWGITANLVTVAFAQLAWMHGPWHSSHPTAEQFCLSLLAQIARSQVDNA